MKILKPDVSVRIFNLFLEIKCLIEENDLNKHKVIADFIDILNVDFEESVNEVD